LKEKIILITGATDGIGKQTALELAATEAIVIVHGRNIGSCTKTVEELKKLSGNKKIDLIAGDFSSLSEVRNLALNIKNKYSKLDVLINNAGVYETDFKLSADGYEMTFAVNHLAHFLLTNLLLELLMESSDGRVITVSSMMHAYAGIDLENWNNPENFDGSSAYAFSKAANVLFAYHLAELIKTENITSNVLHPGVISTKLLHKGFGFGGGSVKSGAATSVYLAVSKEVEGVSGKYFVNSQVAPSAEFTYNKKLQNKLWQLSEKLVV